MVDELIVTQGAFEFGEAGLVVHGSPSYDEWAAAFGETQALWVKSQRMWPWILGDFVIEGENRYGETYAQAITVTGMRLQTLMNYASLCRQFPKADRHPELSTSLHDAVRALGPDDRERWLELAADNDWTRQELRDRVQVAAVLPSDNGSHPTAGGTIPVVPITAGIRFTMAELALLLNWAADTETVPDELYVKIEAAWARCELAVEDVQAMERGESNG